MKNVMCVYVCVCIGGGGRKENGQVSEQIPFSLNYLHNAHSRHLVNNLFLINMFSSRRMQRQI